MMRLARQTGADMPDLLEGLNEAQRKAVTHKNGPLLIVAGAGTGKTTVLTRRYAYLLKEQGLTTDNLLALTFTEKAATEMEDRVLEQLSTGAYDFCISTFHGFCQRILEAHALEIGLPNRFRVLTPTDAWLMLRRHLDELPLDHFRPLGNPTRFLEAIVSHISRAKDEGVTPERYLDFVKNAVLDQDVENAEGDRKRLQELADVYAAYRKILLDAGCLDFGDLIMETLRLFRERPAILETYRKQFRYVLVDEFQDTNWAQYELLKLLLGLEKNLTVVGDDDQAIYKFRGASLANILQFKDDFPDATTVSLTHNYRSLKEILDQSYGFIQKNDPNRLEVKLKDTGLCKRLEAIRGDGGEVNVLWCRDSESEAETVVRDIIRRHNEDAEATWNDFAILVRSNDGAEPFVRACDRLQIPFQFMALRGLYATPVVLDAFALLSILDGSHESSAVWRALHVPCYGLSAPDMSELLHHANRKGVTLWQAAKDASHGMPGMTIGDDGRKIIGRFVFNVERLSDRARRESAFRILHATLEDTGYLAMLLRLPEQEKEEAIRMLNGFANRVKRYESMSHDPSLHGFLDEFRMEIESGEDGALEFDPDAGPEFVQIMTVHRAKGLEFKYVYVVSMVDQRFPTRQRSEAIALPDGLVQERLPEGDAHLEEERRLFYVAMTRAKNVLTLTGAKDYGGTREKKPSVFLAEAGLSIESHSEPHPGPLLRKEREIDVSPDKERLEAVYELKKKFSFTQLAAFRKCPYQYKLAHIYRIPILGSYQKSFGQSIHLAFQRLLALHLTRGTAAQASLFGSTDYAGPVTAGGFRVTDEEAQTIFDEVWIDEWYPDREKQDAYKTQGRLAMKHFWTSCAEHPPAVEDIEKEFTLVFGPHAIKGKIDRVDRLEGGAYSIVDYKTGDAKDELSAEDKEQVHLYQIALENSGKQVGKLAYVFVKDWTVAEVEPLSDKKREDFLAKIEERIRAILSSDYEATPGEHTCKFCDFKNVCQFRKL